MHAGALGPLLCVFFDLEVLSSLLMAVVSKLEHRVLVAGIRKIVGMVDTRVRCGT